MEIDEKAFNAFMTAYWENGPTGLGMRKNLEAYEAAKAPTTDQPVEKPDIGDICSSCKGKGEWDDAEPGDISFRSFYCKKYDRKGGTGLTGEILHYLRKKSMGHNEVDAPAIAALAAEYIGAPERESGAFITLVEEYPGEMRECVMMALCDFITSHNDGDYAFFNDDNIWECVDDLINTMLKFRKSSGSLHSLEEVIAIERNADFWADEAKRLRGALEDIRTEPSVPMSVRNIASDALAKKSSGDS